MIINNLTADSAVQRNSIFNLTIDNCYTIRCLLFFLKSTNDPKQLDIMEWKFFKNHRIQELILITDSSFPLHLSFLI